MVGVVRTVKETLYFWSGSCLYIQGGYGHTVGLYIVTCMVVIRYISCVGRSSIYTDCDSPQFSGVHVLQ